MEGPRCPCSHDSLPGCPHLHVLHLLQKLACSSVERQLIHVLVRAEFLHVKPGKGAAFVRTKLKNYITGNVVDRTFRAGESAVQAVLEKRDCQYTYQDGDEVRSCFQI